MYNHRSGKKVVRAYVRRDNRISQRTTYIHTGAHQITKGRTSVGEWTTKCSSWKTAGNPQRSIWLSEAPRLWYLRAREILEGLGWKELQCSRSTFVLKDDAQETIATLNLHVDDGVALGEKGIQDTRRLFKT